MTAHVDEAPAPALDFEAVQAHDLSRHFGRRRALSHVTLTFRAGEILGLFGPNGAGKSTLLGILSTLSRPSSGEVRYGGRTARELGDPLRARIGVLGHDLFLYGDLSARENLEFFARLYGLPPAIAHATQALERARIQTRGGDRVSGFSRGLRQRLALERALLHEPRLILLDEPFTGLDDDSTSLLVARLGALKQAGAIVVMATHDFESAQGLVDRAVCLTNGRAAEFDLRTGTEALRERYRAATQESERTGSGRTLTPGWPGGQARASAPPEAERSPGVHASVSPRVSGGPKASGTHVLRAAWLIARKDLIVEARSRELAYTTLFFAMACVLVFAFSFVRDGRAPEGAAAGILWVAIAFSGTLALGRAFERERQAETLRALLLAPVERAAVYLGKLVGLLVLMAGVELVLVPVVGLLFGASIGPVLGTLLSVLAAGTVGFAAVGTLLAAMLVRAHSRDVLLPILLYPIAVPVIIAGVRGTAALFAPAPDFAMAQTWLAMLIFFDAVFATLALWLFAPVVADQ